MRAAHAIAIAAGLALIAGCGTASAKRKPDRKNAVPMAADWKTIVTPRDMDRIRNWRVAFMRALDEAKASGNATSMTFEGSLLDPDASIGGDPPPAGVYRCRTLRLGKGKNGRGYVVFPHFPCAVTDEGEVKGFANGGKMQRSVGLIFKNDAHRAIFLGTVIIGDELRAIDYGRDAYRDMAGAVERIGPQRWRVILPYPGVESTMDVVEMTPITKS
jgi:hypothetical protein